MLLGWKMMENESWKEASIALLFYGRSLLAVPLLLRLLCAFFLGTFPRTLNRLAGSWILTVPSFRHDEASSNLSAQGRQAGLLQTLLFVWKKNARSHSGKDWGSVSSLLCVLLRCCSGRQANKMVLGHSSICKIYHECSGISHLCSHKIFWLRELALNELCWVPNFRYYIKEGVLPIVTDFCK